MSIREKARKWLSLVQRSVIAEKPQNPRRRPRHRPQLEELEDRILFNVQNITSVGNDWSYTRTFADPIPTTVSDDGRFTLIFSQATNLVAGQVEGNTFGHDLFLFDRYTNSTKLISHTPGNETTTGNNSTPYAAISGDGNWVVFQSSATNLVSGVTDANNASDIFLYEVASGSIRLVSHTLSSMTTTGSSTSEKPVISDDGNYVAFTSSSNNLAVGDSNNATDVYLYERSSGSISLISRTPSGTAGNAASDSPAISRDGNAIAFRTNATNIGSVTDGNGSATTDVFVYHRNSGQMSLVSRSAAGPFATSNGASDSPVINEDGSYVAFRSAGTNLVNGQSDPNGASTDIFLWSHSTGNVELVSHAATSLTTTSNGLSAMPAISGDGNYIVFQSLGANLVPGQSGNNGVEDIFLYERSTGAITLVSHIANNATQEAGGFGLSGSISPVISRHGGYVAFSSHGYNMVAGAGFGNGISDVYVFERATNTIRLASHVPNSATVEGNNMSDLPVISADGTLVAFHSRSSNLNSGDTNGKPDVYLYNTGGIDLGGGPAGGILQVAEFGGHQYILLAQNNWTNSEQIAISMGGHLATINSQAENDFIYNTFTGGGVLNRSLWIGYNDVAAENSFVWASGESSSFVNWGLDHNNSLEPNGWRSENYVHILSPTHWTPSKWNDQPDMLVKYTPDSSPLFGVVEINNANALFELPAPGTFNLKTNGSQTEIRDSANAVVYQQPTSSLPVFLVQGNAGADDTLSIDLTSGDGIPAGGLLFDGGAGGNDTLAILGGSQGSVTYNFTNASDGCIVMQNYGTIHYLGLEPITNSGSATDIIFNLPATGNIQVVLEDDGVSGNGLLRLRSEPANAGFETVIFAAPSGSLTINRGSATDDIVVNALPDFNAALTIGTTAAPFDQITFAGAITLAADRNLTAIAASNLSLSGSNSDLTVSGAGQVTLAGATLSLSSGASITSGGQTISVQGDQIAFDVSATPATINAGSGTVTLRPNSGGRAINLGGADNGSTLGLADAELDRITAGAVQIGQTGGAITISATISPANYQSLVLGAGVTISATGGFASDIFSASTYERLQANGAVSITAGATLTATATGGFVPSSSDSFTLIDNISTSGTTGTFSGKSEGATVTVGGVPTRLTYVGGTGNDVVLRQPDIFGRVWDDNDSDGVQDAGEPGVTGAVAELFGSTNTTFDDSDDVSLGVQITNSLGQYRFDGVASYANYYVVFRTPVGFTFTSPDLGGNDAVDSDSNSSTGRTAMFALTGASDVAKDSGLLGASPAFGLALFAGNAGWQEGKGIALDASGNAYVTGIFDGTVDFDSGPGASNLISGGQTDAFVAKYTSTGALAWVRALGGTLSDQGFAIALDAGGNVYTTGVFRGTADFDPSSGTAANLTSAGSTYADLYVSKLDNNGNYIWARNMGGSGFPDETSLGIAVDSAGNVFTTGSFDNSPGFAPDFDPSPSSSFTLDTFGSRDIFISKLDSAGNFVWAKQLGGSSYDFANGIAVDADGNVYSTGLFNGTADFDPAPGTSANLTSAGASDAYVVKLDNDGNYVWARRFGGTSGDKGNGITVDAYGNVFTIGAFQGTADFDPGTGIANLVSGGLADVYVSKLDSAGNYAWAKRLGGANGQEGNGIALDGDGSIYTTGILQVTADFDPGSGTASLTSAGLDDIFVSKLDTAGNYVSAVKMGGTSNDTGIAIMVDATGNIFTTGRFQGTADFDPGTGAFNGTGAGGDDFFLSKLVQSSIGDRVWHDQDSDGVQDAGEPGIFGAVVELFGSTNTTLGDSDDVSLGVRITDAQGLYQFIGPASYANYYLVFRPPVGFTFTTKDVGSDSTDSDADTSTGRTVMFTLSAGQTDTSRDAGLVGAAPGFGFAVRAGGTSADRVRATATVADGNAYSVGVLVGTVDLDPGPGTYNLVGGSGTDVYVAKYSPGGALVWARLFDGSSNTFGEGIFVDAAGNVYTTGFFQGTVDFDSGAGASNLISAGDYDIFVSKLDSDGNLVWARQMGGNQAGGEFAKSIAVDSSGGVYITGHFWGSADFNPGTGTANLTPVGASDTYVSKLDSAGNFVWVKQLGGSSLDEGQGLTVDAAGNVIVTGKFQGTADFDPGTGTTNLISSGNYDIFVVKLTNAGDLAWAGRMGSTQDDEGFGLAADSAGNIYATGYFQGTVDFNPGGGIANITSAGNSDAFVSKFDSTGSYVWAKQLGGSSADRGYGVAVDADGNVLTTGWFSTTADFDPSASSANLISVGGVDAFISKLDSAGNYVSAKQFGGTGADIGYAIVLDAAGNATIGGEFNNTADFDPGAGTFNLSSAGSTDSFVARLPRIFTTASVSGGNLTITDSENNADDNLIITLSSGNVLINDPDNPLTAGSGATQVNANTISVPFSSISAGSITFNAGGGNDTLTINLAGGDFIPTGGLIFNGGTAGDDGLVIIGGTQGTVTYNFTNANDGSIVMANFGTVTYTGLEPISNSGTASDIIFNLPTTGNIQAILEDDGNTGNTLSRFRSSPVAFEQVDFANPTGSLTINRGSSTDDLTVNALPNFNASLTIGASTTQFETLTFAGEITLASDKSLNAFASAAVSLSNTTSDLTTGGTGAVSITTARSISMASGSSITTANGGITLSAAGTPSGNYAGIEINGATLTTTGTGNITLSGKGGDSATAGNFSDNRDGIQVKNGAIIRSTGTAVGSGAITLNGTGGPAHDANTGVFITSSGLVTSVVGNISITGASLGTGVDHHGNYGVLIDNSGQVTSTGSGANAAAITINGTGSQSADASAHDNQGVRIASTIMSAAGAIQVIGTKGTGAVSNSPALQVTGAGNVTSTSGNVTLVGDSIEINTGTAIVSAAAGVVTLRQNTANTQINLGGADATGSPNTLGLTDAELDRITAGTLQIGDSASGAITVSAAITQSNNLSLTTGHGVTLNSAITMTVDKHLSIDAQGASDGTINLATTNSDMSASGTGSITFTTVRNISLASGASVTTTNGNLTLSANQQAMPTGGSFTGISVNGGIVQVTGSGMLAVSGRGGNTGSGQMGVEVKGNGLIQGGTTGSVSVSGTGGPSSGSSNFGVFLFGISSSAAITSAGADVNVTGNGTTGGYGVAVEYGAIISAGGSGAVTVQGTAPDNSGVVVTGENSTNVASITSNGGAISVTGTASTAGSGIQVGTGLIAAGGSGSVTLLGAGGANLSSSYYGVLITGSQSSVTSAGGNVSITAMSSPSSPALRIDAAGTIKSGGTGALTITADNFSADGTAVIQAGSTGTSTATIKTRTSGTLINLGGADVLSGSPLSLGLTDAELDRIIAGKLVIGDSDSGAITVTSAISRAGGILSLQSGSTVSQNTGATISVTSSDLAVRAGGAITLDQGNAIVNLAATTISGGISYVEGATAMTIGFVDGLAGLTTSNAPINISTQGGSITVDAAAVSINAGTSTVSLAAGATDLTIGAVTIQGSGGITLTGDDMIVFPSATINAGSSTVTLQSQTTGNAINLGSTVDTTANTLELSDAELDRITAGTLQIGNSNSGDITVSSAISPSLAPNLTVTTGATQNLYVNATATVTGTFNAQVTTVNLDANISAATITGMATTVNVDDNPSGHLQDAIDVAATGALINVAAGTYAGGNVVNKSLIIQGAGVGLTTINGGGTARGFTVDSGVTATLASLTITGGSATNGGAINNSGTLAVDSSLLDGNTAAGASAGGAIFNAGILNVNATTISNNTAGDGALYNHIGALATVRSSTFTGNLALSDGGAIRNRGTITISNTTLSGNQSNNDGGAIANQGGFVTVANSTVVSNVSNSQGGGLYQEGGGTTYVGNSIVALNSAASGGSGFPNLHSNGGSITGDPGFNIFGGDPQLAALANNGGLTQTRALNAGSAAINSGGRTTFLTSAVTDTDMTLPVEFAWTIASTPGSYLIQIDSEQILVTAVPNSTTLTVTRGANNTTPAPHSNGAGLYLLFDQRGSGYARFVGSAPDIGAFETQVSTHTMVAVVGNDLIVTDVFAGGKNDNLFVFLKPGDPTFVRVYDPDNPITADSGTLQVNTNTVDVPVASITGQILFSTLAGNDSLTVDVASGNLAKPITYDGGAGSDSLSLTGGGPFANVTHAFSSANSGNVAITGNGLVSYTGLEPVTDNLIAANREFTFNGGSESITLSDAGGASMTIDSDLGEAVTFANPTSSLTINAGTGNDTVTISSVDANGPFNAALTINGGSGNDTINLNADITLATNKNLDVDLTDDAAGTDVDAINIAANVNLILAGTGAATLKASQLISMASGSSIETVNGAITLEANQQSTALNGSFTGIALDGVNLLTTGAGAITIKGRGGNDAFTGGHAGVHLFNLANVHASGTGDVTIVGVGGAGTQDNFGVRLSGFAVTDDGDLSITGTGGAGSGSQNAGVWLDGSTFTMGAGSVSIRGEGGAGTFVNYGVNLVGAVTGGSGGVIITGIGGAGTQSGNIGVVANANVSANAGGDVTITGTGGSGTTENYGIATHGALLSTTGNGALSLIGTGGSGTQFNDGIAVIGSADSGSQLRVEDGLLSLEGVAGTGDDSHGIYLWASSMTTATLESTSDGDITLTADSMFFEDSPTIDAGNNIVTLQPRTTDGTVGINLGGSDSATQLGLTDAELDRITAGTLQIGDTNTGPITISADITQPGKNLLLTTGAGVAGSGGLTTGAATATMVTINQAGNSTYSGILGGTGSDENNFSFTKTGAGTLTLTAANTFAGGTTVSGGVLGISSDSNLGMAPATATPAHLIIDGATLQVSGAVTINSNRGIAVGPSTGSGSGTLDILTDSLTYGGVIANHGAGTGSLIKTGQTLFLSGVSTYSGTTTNASGNLAIIDPTGALPAGEIINHGVLRLERSADTTVANLISGSGGLFKGGSGKLILSNANNSYTGATRIEFGTLSVNSLADGGLASPIGASSNSPASLVFVNGTFEYTGTGHSTDRLFAFTSVDFTIAANGTGTLNFTNTGSAGVASGDRTLTLAGSGVAILNADLPDANLGYVLSVTKAGTGEWTLAGDNLYSGATTVSNGKLYINGSTAATSTITVQNGAMLGGTGDINGPVVVNTGGHVAPGVSPGTLESGNVAFANDSDFDVEIHSATLYDQLDVTGTVTLNGGNLNLSLGLGYTPANGDSFTIIHNDGNDAIMGLPAFKVNGTTISDGGSFLIGTTRFVIDYTGGTDNNDVVLTVENSATFSGLSAPTIVYGTSALTTISGAITGNNGQIPTGSVQITLNGVAQSAAINSTTGEFFTQFDVHALQVSGSPYTIAFDYAGDATFTAVSDTSQLTVTPATLTVAAQHQSKVYGASDPVLSYTVSGLRFTDTEAGVLSGSLSRASGENVGSYAISQGTLTANSNYTIDFTGNTLDITAATLTVAAQHQSKVYGVSDPVLSYTVSGLRFTDTEASVLSGSLSRAGGENVGSYAISQGTLTANSNYTIDFTGNTLDITAATLTVAAQHQSKVYGVSDPVLSYTVSGLRFTDTEASVLSGSLSRAGGENVGSYAISQGTLTANSNYTIDFTGNTLDITAATLTVAAQHQSKVYGASDPVLSYTVSGLRFTDTEAGVLSGSLSRAGGENVGSYAISQGTLTANSNYTIDFTGNTLDITAATLTVAAQHQSKVYGASDPVLSYTVSGLQFSDMAASVLSGSLSRASGENVGSYAISQGTLTANSNYTIDFTGNTLDITAATLTVAAQHQSKVYGASDPVLSYTVSGLRFTDTEAGVLSGSLSRASGENVGSYAISQGTLTANSNYTIDFTGNTLDITAATLTVAAQHQSKVYGASDPVLSYTVSGLRLTDTEASVLSGSLSRASGENVGFYAISQGTLTANSNYTIDFTGNTLDITAATLTVAAQHQSKVYGASDPVLSYTVSGLRLSDMEAGVLSGSLSRASGENVGFYAISQGTLTANSNYTIDFTGNTLDITAATLTVAAQHQSKVYGASDPVLSYTVSGLRFSDMAASVLSGSLSRAGGENVGFYAISQGTLTANSNYTIDFTGNTLDITAATLTVAAQHQSKVYGASDPVLSYTVSGLRFTDTEAGVLSGSLSRAGGENVGFYAISQGTLTANSNYTIDFTGNTLDITAATLTVAAQHQSKVYGASDPVLSYTVSGLRFTDTEASVLSGSLSRASGENVGFYAISQGTLTANSNYTIDFTGNTLDITAATLTVAAQHQSKVYGASDPVLSYTVSGLRFTDTEASVLSGSLSRASGENVGSYAISQGTLTANSNYTIDFTGNTLDITPRSASVTPTAASKTVGESDPVLTGTLTGFLAGDGVTASYSRTPGEAVDVYTISATLGPVGALDNYAITYNTATFTITALGEADPVFYSTGNKLFFIDEDEDMYIVQLTGGGQAAVTIFDPDDDGKGPISSIVLSGTNPAKSVLSVEVKRRTAGEGQPPYPQGNLLVDISSISGTGLKSIAASRSDLVDAGINLTGTLGSLKIHDVFADITTLGTAAQKTSITANVIGSGSDINIGSTLAGFVASTVREASITAPAIGKMTIANDFDADLTLTATGSLPALGSASIGGNVRGSAWNIADDVRALAIKGFVEDWDLAMTGTLASLSLGSARGADVSVTGALGKVAIKGAVNDSTFKVQGTTPMVTSFTTGEFHNSRLYVGFVPTQAEVMAGGNFTTNALLKSFTVTGKQPAAFTNSVVAATKIGAVKITSVPNTSTGVKFGVLANVSIGSLAVASPKFTYVAAQTTPQEIYDFQVKLI